jgi:integrase
LCLGGFPEIGVEQARKLAAQHNGTIAQGGNPAAERRQIRAEMTLGELWEHFLEKHAKLKKRSWKTDENRWDNHLADWSGRRLSDIATAVVAALHARIGRTQPITANRVGALLHTLYEKARKLGYAGPNPAGGLDKFPERPRERYLNAEELPRFFAAIDAEPQPWPDLFRMVLFTGARVGNVMSMRWAEVDLTAETWFIPREKFKAGKPVLVHLPDPAMEVLRVRRAAADRKAEWVFPSPDDAERHVSRPYNAWSRVCTSAELDDFRIHDLRHTMASWQVATGANLPVVGKTLGHTAQATTARYVTLDLDPVRRAVNLATAAMLATGGAAKEAPK